MKLQSRESLKAGVLQQCFDLRVADQWVPGVLWTPESHTDLRVLVAMGHGGSQHKQTHAIRSRAVDYAERYGWATVAIDAPGHGARISCAEAEVERQKTLARVRGDANAPALPVKDKISYLDKLAATAVPEWRAALDAVLSLEKLQNIQAIGYWGVSMGTWIGVPLLAAEARFQCAVLGLAHLHPKHNALRQAAERITCPLQFVFQLHDPIRDRHYGLDLFDAFASRDKSMHVYPGGHTDIPDREVHSWDRFFRHHLD